MIPLASFSRSKERRLTVTSHRNLWQQPTTHPQACNELSAYKWTTRFEISKKKKPNNYVELNEREVGTSNGRAKSYSTQKSEGVQMTRLRREKLERRDLNLRWRDSANNRWMVAAPCCRNRKEATEN